MKRRDEDVIGARNGNTDTLPLFTEPKPNWAETYTPEHRNADIARLVPLAIELAERAGVQGITVSNLRFAGVRRGLLTGQETGRRLSFLGAVMKSAGLKKTGEFRRSSVSKAHGNLNAVWRME